MAARAAWQQLDSEAELKAFGGNLRSKSSTGWSRMFLGLFFIAGVSFVSAYYVPLHRAHLSLADKHTQLAEKSQASDQALAEVRSQLESAVRQLDPLLVAQKQENTARQSASEHLETAKTDLASKLSALAKKVHPEVSLLNGHIAVSVPGSVLFLPTTTTVSPLGKSLLCEIAKFGNGNGSSLEVDAVVEAAAAATSGTPSAWARSAALAASVAEVLEQKCSVSASKLSAVGRGAAPGTATSGTGALGTATAGDNVQIAVISKGSN